MLRSGVLTFAFLLASSGVALAAPAGSPELGFAGTDGEIDVSSPTVGERLDPVAIIRPDAASNSTLTLARVYDGADLEGGVLVKLTGDGDPDPGFGGGDGIVELPPGFLPIDVPESLAVASAHRGRPLVALPNGDLLVAGTDGDAVVLKLAANGVDPVGTFGTAGRAVALAGPAASASIAVRPGTGEVLVAGTTDLAGPNRGIFLRELSATGAPTTGLGGTGLLQDDPTPGATLVDRIVDLHVQASGGVLLARDRFDGNVGPDAGSPVNVQRYLLDGSVDATFGTAGTASLGEPVLAARLTPQAGGGFVLAGARPAPATVVLSAILDADGQGSAPRSTSWGPAVVRPATLLPQADGALAVFGDRQEDGARPSSARIRPDGTRDPRWATESSVLTNVGGVGSGSSSDNASVVDAVARADGHSAYALVNRTTAGVLRVVRISLNAAPNAVLNASPTSADGPSQIVTLDASNTVDPDGPTDARIYRFDTDGDGSDDVTGSASSTTVNATGPVTRTARVRVEDSLGRVSEPAFAQYEVRDGTPAPTPTPTPSPTPPPSAGGPLVSFPQTGSSILTPPAAQVGTIPGGPLVSASFLPPSGAFVLAAPVQVGGVDLEPALPRDGDRVTVRFKVDVRNSGAEVSLCKVIGPTCPGLASNPVVSRSGNVVSFRVSVTANAPQSLTRYRVRNAAGREVEVPISFAVRPAQTIPDYDIVGVELTQGTQRETASARTAPPDRDAAYDGVVLAGMDKEWGRPITDNAQVAEAEVPPARIRVWVVAHGIRAATAPAPKLYVSLGRPQLSRNGQVVRYGYAPLKRAPATVPVTAETGLPPDLRARDAVPFVFTWIPDRSVPRIRAQIEGGVAQCDECPQSNDSVTIRAPRVAVSRMRPTNVFSVVRQGSRAFVPDDAPLLQARTLPRIKCLFGAGGNSTAEACRDLDERLSDEAPADGEAYRSNDRFFAPGDGPLASLAPFVLGANRQGSVFVPDTADAFLTGLLVQLASSTSRVTRTTVALNPDCVRTSTEPCSSGTAVLPPLLGAFAVPAPTAVVRHEARYRVAGLARGLHLAYGLRPASGRGGATGAARWAPDEAGALGGFGVDITAADERAVGGPSALRATCGDLGVRDLTSSCVGPTSITGANGGWISPRRWDALLVGARERAEIVNGNVVSSGAELPCPYRALNTRLYAGSTVGNCSLAPSTFDPRPVDTSFPRSVAPGSGRQAAAGGTSPAISVTLRATGQTVTGLALVRLDAPTSALAAAAAAASTTRVVVRGLDAAGAVVARSAAVPQAVDLGAEGTPGTSVDVDAAATGLLPASAAITRVEVLVDGAVVGRIDRRGTPTVALSPPAQIGASGPVALGIRASDPDGDPLLSTLAFSEDGGRTFTTTATSADPAALALDAADLPRTAAGAGRLRVTVSDGFDSVSTDSGPLTFAGPATSIRIVGNARRALRGDDTTLGVQIEGDRGAAVRWTVRGRRVASGPTIGLGRLKAGRHPLVATTTDGSRTVRSAAVTVVVRSSPPVLRRVRLLRGCRVQVAALDAVTVKQGRRTLGRVAAGKARTVRARCAKRRARITLVSANGARTLTVR